MECGEDGGVVPGGGGVGLSEGEWPGRFWVIVISAREQSPHIHRTSWGWAGGVSEGESGGGSVEEGIRDCLDDGEWLLRSSMKMSAAVTLVVFFFFLVPLLALPLVEWPAISSSSASESSSPEDRTRPGLAAAQSHSSNL